MLLFSSFGIWTNTSRYFLLTGTNHHWLHVFSPYILASDGKCWKTLKRHDRREKMHQQLKKSWECFLKDFGLFYSFHTVTNRQLSKSVVGLERWFQRHFLCHQGNRVLKEEVSSSDSTLVNTRLKLLFSRGPAQVKYILRHAGSRNTEKVSWATTKSVHFTPEGPRGRFISAGPLRLLNVEVSFDI